MITIDRLTKRFGDMTVLDGLCLEIGRGRVTAVVGPNAAGKTTLMKSIVGLTRPDGGRILVDGVRVNGDERYRADIGYMPQIARFPENMTAAELLTLARDLRRSGGHPMTIDEELIQHFDVASFARKPLRTLSGGTRQKVNAALAFLFAPSVLMLDEPTAGLDPVASSALKDKILKVRAEHRTVIVTSHVMSELEELADDVALLVDGSLRFTGTVQEIKRSTRQTTLERAVANLLSTRPVAA
jgi:Cu-processing system ATP-binding protein